MLLHTLIFIILTVQGGQADLAIVGPKDVEVPAGGEAILTCQVHQPYKFCTFINPTGVHLNMDPHVIYEEGRISFTGDEEIKKSCGVKISNVTEVDSGVWQCKVTVVQNGNSQEGRSRANVMLIPSTLKNSSLDTSSIDTDVEMNEGLGGGKIEATYLMRDLSQSILAHGESDSGDKKTEEDTVEPKLVQIGNKTNGKDLKDSKKNEKADFVIVPEIEVSYTVELPSGVTDETQYGELNQAVSSSLRAIDLNPSTESPENEYLKEVASQFIPFEESKDGEFSDLTEEHVVIVVIITIILTAIFITFIAKIKKMLCFKLNDDDEDAEKSTLKMDSIQENRKSSNDYVKMAYEEVKEGTFS